MQDIRHKLTVLHSTDGVAFTDKSFEAFDLTKDEISGTTHSLYVGFKKPINAVFVSLPADAENTGTFSWSYWNGSSFSAIASLHDGTKNLTRSALVQWDRNLSNEAATTINATELYWYKITHSTADAFRVLGLNILLCDESDLQDEFHYASYPQYLPDGETSQIRALVAARNAVMRTLSVSPWDLLHVAEAKDAAVFYALHVICKNASDTPDDADDARSRTYYDRFLDTKSKISVSVDENDDGFEQPVEVKNKTLAVKRFTR